MPLSSVEETIDDIRQGKFVIIVDDEDRENEGDLAIAAEWVTPESISFMATYGRGLVCMSMKGARLDELNLPLMVAENTARLETAFTVSVDYKQRTSTGISAHDRAATVEALIDPKAKPEDFARPGHLFPLRYAEGGVLVRAGQTEAIVDLTTMAGLYPAGVICEIMGDDGTMQRIPELEKFSNKHGVKLISVAQIIDYRQKHETLIEKVAETRLPTNYGEFTAIAFKSILDADEHLALVKGKLDKSKPILVRMHSQCLTGDTFGSLRCDCGEQISGSLKLIAEEGTGVLVYMRQEGRGIGLHNKIKAYALQDNGMDTVEANEELGFDSDLRWYGIGAQILVSLGVRQMRLLTNNPKKVVGLESYGLQLVERVPIVTQPNTENWRYLVTKQDKLGHILGVPKDEAKRKNPPGN